MTLGDIIKEYLEEHTVNEFIKDSGISKAYTYNLINNKGTNGSAPTPTIETISKVARGVHSDFDTIFSKLDQDTVLSTQSRYNVPETTEVPTVGFKVSSHFLFTETASGVVQIRLKDTYKNFLSYLSDAHNRDLLIAADGCTPEQIQVAIDLLKTFKGQK